MVTRLYVNYRWGKAKGYYDYSPPYNGRALDNDRCAYNGCALHGDDCAYDDDGCAHDYGCSHDDEGCSYDYGCAYDYDYGCAYDDDGCSYDYGCAYDDAASAYDCCSAWWVVVS